MKITRHQTDEQEGFTLVETLIALLLLSGSFLALAGAIPTAAMIHRGALERQEATSLAQVQMEYFLTNPGPFPGETGTETAFQNKTQFPPKFKGSYNASGLGQGLTLIVVDVTPPHASMVELSAIDTTVTILTK